MVVLYLIRCGRSFRPHCFLTVQLVGQRCVVGLVFILSGGHLDPNWLVGSPARRVFQYGDYAQTAAEQGDCAFAAQIGNVLSLSISYCFHGQRVRLGLRLALQLTTATYTF